jgi:hypothetical protein
MTSEAFKALIALQDSRVRMTFSDGQQLIATLHSVTTDLDESQHLIFEKVEWSTLPKPQDKFGYYYAAGEELISCTLVNDAEG